MKLNAEIAGHKYTVDLRRDGQRVLADIDGRRYEVDVHEAHSDAFLMVASGRVFDCRVEGRPESAKTVNVIVGTTPYEIAIGDPKRLRGSSKAGAQADGVARIIAPMPGKVVRVLVEPGQQIDVGAGVIVVEAMKMQNELKSPKAGSVVTLNVAPGATVNAGDVLAVVE